MNVVIVSGFTGPGKAHLIREIVDVADRSHASDRLDLLLFELTEGDLSLPLSGDALVIREMGGGCPCCTLEGDLRKVLNAGDLGPERSLLIETGGGCDLRRLRTIVQEECPSCEIACVVVMESPTMKDILEIVPIIGENITNADLLVILDPDGV